MLSFFFGNIAGLEGVTGIWATFRPAWQEARQLRRLVHQGCASATGLSAAAPEPAARENGAIPTTRFLRLQRSAAVEDAQAPAFLRPKRALQRAFLSPTTTADEK